MILSCPYCQSVVMRSADGSCPACHARIVLDEFGQPVVEAGSENALRPVRQVRGELIGTDGQSLDEPEDEPPVPYPSIAGFYQRLFEITPRVFVTQTIIAINAAIFLLMAFTSGAWLNPDAPTLIEWGANFGPRTLAGEWWRLGSSMFIHIGVLHVTMNMWVLWDIGRLVERLMGNLGFLILYLVSGICGSLASVYWHPDVASAGASGAVFGTFGGLMGFMLYRTDSVPPLVLGSIRNSGFAFLVYNLVFGFSVPGIDMAAHLGGLAAGFVFGLMLSQPLDRITAASRTLRNAAVLGVGVAIIAAAILAAPPPLVDLRAKIEDFSQTEQTLVDKFNDGVRRHTNRSLDDDGFAALIENEILPLWRELRRSWDQIGEVPRRQRELVETLRLYAETRDEAWSICVEALKSRDPSKMTEYEKKQDIAQALLRKLDSSH